MKKASPRPSSEPTKTAKAPSKELAYAACVQKPTAKAPSKELAYAACVRLDRAEHAQEDSEWLCYLAQQKHAEAQLKHNKAQHKLADAELKLADAKLALGK
jgi:hypothetical protein